jgi:hypothetical protein
MSHEERNTLATALTALLVNGYFLWRVAGMFADGTSTAPDGLLIWARLMIWIIPVSILGSILMIILVSILWAIATGEGKPRFLVDERDRDIQMKGMGATMLLATAGFLGSIAALAWGASPFVAFNIGFAGFAAGSLAGDLVKLCLYRAWC